MKDIDESSYSPYQKVQELIALQIRITVENPYAIFLQTFGEKPVLLSAISFYFTPSIKRMPLKLGLVWRLWHE